jgi:hypothetical protein
MVAAFEGTVMAGHGDRARRKAARRDRRLALRGMPRFNGQMTDDSENHHALSRRRICRRPRRATRMARVLQRRALRKRADRAKPPLKGL